MEKQVGYGEIGRIWRNWGKREKQGEKGVIQEGIYEKWGKYKEIWGILRNKGNMEKGTMKKKRESEVIRRISRNKGNMKKQGKYEEMGVWGTRGNQEKYEKCDVLRGNMKKQG